MLNFAASGLLPINFLPLHSQSIKQDKSYLSKFIEIRPDFFFGGGGRFWRYAKVLTVIRTSRSQVRRQSPSVLRRQSRSRCRRRRRRNSLPRHRSHRRRTRRRSCLDQRIHPGSHRC